MFRRLALITILICCCSLLLAEEKDKYYKPGAVRLTSDGAKWADKTLKKMSLEEKIGQMLQVRGLIDFENVDSPEFTRLRDEIEKYHIGSVILTVSTEDGLLHRNYPLEAAALTNELQKSSKYPLIFAADFERGLSMRLNSVPAFPAAMAFGATGNRDYARRFAEITAEESRAIGVQWNFFPVADVNINPDNPIINTRSYGEDPKSVGDFAAAYIEGSREGGLLSTAKHFPGHGDTGTDSHLELARVGGDLHRIQTVELPPFQASINAGVDAIMVAHVTVPALEPDPDKVATTSHAIITDLLKKRMGFQGLVVTDAMEMKGLTRLYPPGLPNPAGKAAVDAVKAGNDMVLLPSDLDGAFHGLINAVESGEIPRAQIDNSVRKILRAKASVGLDKARLVELAEVPHRVSRPESLQLAQQIAENAVTLVKDNGRVLPLSPGTAARPAAYQQSGQNAPAPASLVTIIVTDDVRSEMGREFARDVRARAPQSRVVTIDSRTAGPLTPEVMQAVNGAEKVVVAAYIVPQAAKQTVVNGQVTNTVGFDDATGTLMRQVLNAAAAKTVFIAMGSPYLAQNFPEIQNYICTFSGYPSSEAAAARALFGEIPFRGKLPVSLPGIAVRGFGLSTPGHTQQANLRHISGGKQ